MVRLGFLRPVLPRFVGERGYLWQYGKNVLLSLLEIQFFCESRNTP